MLLLELAVYGTGRDGMTNSRTKHFALVQFFCFFSSRTRILRTFLGEKGATK